MIQVTGKMKGLKSKTFGGKERVCVGISYPKPNGYHGEEIIIDVNFSKKQTENEFFKKFESLAGKEISVPIHVLKRIYKDKAYVDYYCADEPTVTAHGTNKPNS